MALFPNTLGDHSVYKQGGGWCGYTCMSEIRVLTHTHTHTHPKLDRKRYFRSEDKSAACVVVELDMQPSYPKAAYGRSGDPKRGFSRFSVKLTAEVTKNHHFTAPRR